MRQRGTTGHIPAWAWTTSPWRWQLLLQASIWPLQTISAHCQLLSEGAKSALENKNLHFESFPERETLTNVYSWLGHVSTPCGIYERQKKKSNYLIERLVSVELVPLFCICHCPSWLFHPDNPGSHYKVSLLLCQPPISSCQKSLFQVSARAIC